MMHLSGPADYFSTAIKKNLASRGVWLIGVQVVPDFTKEMPYANSELAFTVAYKDCGFVVSHSDVMILADLTQPIPARFEREEEEEVPEEDFKELNDYLPSWYVELPPQMVEGGLSPSYPGPIGREQPVAVTEPSFLYEGKLLTAQEIFQNGVKEFESRGIEMSKGSTYSYDCVVIFSKKTVLDTWGHPETSFLAAALDGKWIVSQTGQWNVL